MKRIVQLGNGAARRVAVVDEPVLRLLRGVSSVYELAAWAADGGTSLLALVAEHTSDETLDYEDVYAGRLPWRLLVPVDHPGDPARCLVSGTGLTHHGSARDRNAMHAAAATETDSMRMFRWGVEQGRPAPGEIGIAPEWFFKGVGTILRACGDPLSVPPYAEDGGEEAEIAGVYLVDREGRPRRIGMVTGNEFSDHVFEKRNYLNLAGSKVRPCAIGPELVIDPDFRDVPGRVSICRSGVEIWAKAIATGESQMCHSLANLEHHHFKFESHRRPGDLHVHFYGAHSLSFGDGIRMVDDDEMVIEFAGFGRPLRNRLRVSAAPNRPVAVTPLA